MVREVFLGEVDLTQPQWMDLASWHLLSLLIEQKEGLVRWCPMALTNASPQAGRILGYLKDHQPLTQISYQSYNLGPTYPQRCPP